MRSIKNNMKRDKINLKLCTTKGLLKELMKKNLNNLNKIMRNNNRISQNQKWKSFSLFLDSLLSVLILSGLTERLACRKEIIAETKYKF